MSNSRPKLLKSCNSLQQNGSGGCLKQWDSIRGVPNPSTMQMLPQLPADPHSPIVWPVWAIVWAIVGPVWSVVGAVVWAAPATAPAAAWAPPSDKRPRLPSCFVHLHGVWCQSHSQELPRHQQHLLWLAHQRHALCRDLVHLLAVQSPLWELRYQLELESDQLHLGDCHCLPSDSGSPRRCFTGSLLWTGTQVSAKTRTTDDSLMTEILKKSSPAHRISLSRCC